MDGSELLAGTVKEPLRNIANGVPINQWHNRTLARKAGGLSNRAVISVMFLGGGSAGGALCPIRLRSSPVLPNRQSWKGDHL